MLCCLRTVLALCFSTILLERGNAECAWDGRFECTWFDGISIEALAEFDDGSGLPLAPDANSGPPAS